jgi:hypothetical protein
MFKSCVTAAVAAGVMFFAVSAQAEQAKPVEFASVDRSITFAIPSHALASYVATLDPSSDFSVFATKDCPTDLQQMALRKLWKVLPQQTAESAYN